MDSFSLNLRSTTGESKVAKMSMISSLSFLSKIHGPASEDDGDIRSPAMVCKHFNSFERRNFPILFEQVSQSAYSELVSFAFGQYKWDKDGSKHATAWMKIA